MVPATFRSIDNADMPLPEGLEEGVVGGAKAIEDEVSATVPGGGATEGETPGGTKHKPAAAAASAASAAVWEPAAAPVTPAKRRGYGWTDE
jgi:hypothetical protein